MIEIDGSRFEGGGQIVRTALALSVITKKPFKVKNIRKGRKVPGLKAQHITCIRALKELCDAKAVGDVPGSLEVEFFPGNIVSKSLEINIGTAGSITLFLQSILLPSLFAKGRVSLTIIGGTDVSWSSQIDYFSQVFLPHIRKFATGIECKLKKRGYYPKGGGIVELIIRPKEEKEGSIQLTTINTLMQVKGVSHASKDLLHAQVSERQKRSAESILSSLKIPLNIRAEYADTLSIGSGITLWARFGGEEIDLSNPVIVGADVLGERGKKAEEVGGECARKLLEELQTKAAADSHLADQLVPFLALFGGEVETSEITPHTLANKYVCEMFLSDCLRIEKNKIVSTK